ERWLWTHMVPHEQLMVVAAPLLVRGRPRVAFARIVPMRPPRWLGEPVLVWSQPHPALRLRVLPPHRRGARRQCQHRAAAGKARPAGLRRRPPRQYAGNLIEWMRDPRTVDPSTVIP